MKNDSLSWQTTEYIHRRKTSDWFWALAIIALAGAGASVMLGNVLFALLIIIGSFTLALFGARAPSIITLTLTKKGVLVGEHLYPYSSFESFWISFETNPPRLVLNTRGFLIHRLVFSLDGISPDDVRLFLIPVMEEKEEEPPSLIEQITEYLGF